MYAHERLGQDYAQRQKFLRDHLAMEAFSQLIDHTLLRPDAGEEDFKLLFTQAAMYRFRTVCIPGTRLELASTSLDALSNDGQRTDLCTVVGFPLGYQLTEAKVTEVEAARKHGASEFDFVQNIGWVRDKNWKKLSDEAQAIVCAAQGDVVKVILETSLLSENEIYESALVAARSGVHILKTSTGFGSRGANIQDIVILKRVVEQINKERACKIGIKASGGIKTLEDAVRMIELGATRLGTSAGVNLVSGRSQEMLHSY